MENINEEINTNINKKGFISRFLLLLLTILLFGSLGLSYYFYSISNANKEGECNCVDKLSDTSVIEEDKDISEDESSDWVETDVMGAYTFKYPKGWHVATIWPSDYSNPITVAIHPEPINTAPRGGPLSELSFIDKSGLQNPDEYYQERIKLIEESFISFDKDVIPASFGEIIHFKGSINLFDEVIDDERYIFKIQGTVKDNINVHIIEVLGNPFSNVYSNELRELVLSFKKI